MIQIYDSNSMVLRFMHYNIFTLRFKVFNKFLRVYDQQLVGIRIT